MRRSRYICKHERVWKATGAEIARHYRAQAGTAMIGEGHERMRRCSVSWRRADVDRAVAARAALLRRRRARPTP